MPPNESQRPADRGSRGFTLVEIVIALGIVAFALVALLGLLPVGLRNFTGTMNTAVGSQIAQRVFNNVEISEWSSLTNNSGRIRYFDEQGTELTNSGASNLANCIYWVLVSVSTNAGIGPSAMLPGSNSSTNVVSVTVTVANNPAGWQSASNAFSPTNPNSVSFTALIGKKE